MSPLLPAPLLIWELYIPPLADFPGSSPSLQRQAGLLSLQAGLQGAWTGAPAPRGGHCCSCRGGAGEHCGRPRMRGRLRLRLQGLDGEGGIEARAHVIVPAAARQATWACHSCTLGCAWLPRGSVPGDGVYSCGAHICHSGGDRHLRLGRAVLSGAPRDLGVGHKLVDELLATHFADDVLGRGETG